MKKKNNQKSAGKRQAKSVWETFWNVKKQWLDCGNLLDYLYHQSYLKFIVIDLWRQTNTNIPQRINFTGKLEENNGATMILLLKSSKAILNFYLNSLIAQKEKNNGTSTNIKPIEWNKRF